MAKKTPEAPKAESKRDLKKLLKAARSHQDALQAGGLSSATIDRLENALRGLDNSGKEPGPAVTVLVRDIQGMVNEFQTALRKEFPSNASFQAFFRAGEPMPTGAREVLALAREVAKNAPDFAANLIKYAINAASVKHLSFLGDQLEKELGGADPAQDAQEAAEHVVDVARRVFQGKPESDEFQLS